MRRGEVRQSSRGERILHKREEGWVPREAVHLPRSRAKIRHVDEDTTPEALLALEESVRHGHGAAAGHDSFGLDIAEASRSWEAGRDEQKVAAATVAAAASAVKGKGGVSPAAGGQARKAVFALRFSAKDIPKPLRHLLAGAISGGISKTATAPIESVRMKLMMGHGGGAVKAQATIGEVIAATWQQAGVKGFFAGNAADVIRTAPQKSVQLASFDAYKRMFTTKDPVTGKKSTPGWASTVCGSLAGVTSTITCFPLEVLRTRLACAAPGTYSNMFSAGAKIIAAEGPLSLWAGLGPSLAGVIPYAGVNLGLYDALRSVYTKATGNERVPKTAALYIGSLAGVSAATVTFPLEVVRRRMMMGQKYGGTVQALMAISAKEGTGALFRGCMLNWVKLAPSAGLSFYVYEWSKEVLGLIEEQKAGGGGGGRH